VFRELKIKEKFGVHVDHVEVIFKASVIVYVIFFDPEEVSCKFPEILVDFEQKDSLN
jgi:hypothetical protein